MLAPSLIRVPGEPDAVFHERVATEVGGTLVSARAGGANDAVLVVRYPDGCQAAVVCQANGSNVRAWPEAALDEVRREQCLDRTGLIWFAPDDLVAALPHRDCATHVSAAWRGQHGTR